MCKHEEKYCPRCNQLFECKAGNITQCQCFGLVLSDEEKQLLEKNYNDCLCRNCLIEIKNEFAMQATAVTFAEKKNDV